MPITLWKLTPTGKLERLEAYNGPNGETLNSISQRLPGGVYTTFRTFHSDQILPLESHIHRLEESAGLIGIPIVIDREAIHRALRLAVQPYLPGDTRLRLTLDLEQEPGSLYISVELLQTPDPEDYLHGVRLVTIPYQRENPLAKRTNFIDVAEQARRYLPDGAYEGLLVTQDGRLLEGLSSNFFAILPGQASPEVWTAGEGVLSGITRALVLEIVTRLGIPLRLECPRLNQLGLMQEAFITSSSRSILPVRLVDVTRIASGDPGPLTKRLMEVYRTELEARLVRL